MDMLATKISYQASAVMGAALHLSDFLRYLHWMSAYDLHMIVQLAGYCVEP